MIITKRMLSHTTIMKHSITSYNINALLKNKLTTNTSDIRNYMQMCRNGKKEELKTFHRTFLINKIKTYRNNSVFLTDANKANNNNHGNQKIKRTLSNEEPIQFNIKPSKILSLSLSSYNSNDNLSLSKAFYCPDEKYKLFFSDVSNLKNDYKKKTETTKSFIEKSKVILKSKYIKTLQLEQFNKIKERNQIMKSQYDLMKYSIKNDHNLLTKFLFEMKKYVEYLNHTLEESRYELNKISIIRSNLEKDVKDLQKVVHSKQLKKIKAEDFKEFLLKVKFKTMQLNNIPNEKLLPYGYNKSEGIICKCRTSLQKIVLNDNITLNLTSKPIFSSVGEFMSQMKEIEENTFKLFKVNDKQGERVKVLNISKRKTSSIDAINLQSEKDEQAYITTLLQERDAAMKLYNTNVNILQQITNDLNKEQINQEVLIKIKNILLHLPIDLEEDFNEINVYDLLRTLNNKCDFDSNILLNGKKRSLLFYLITLVEKVLLFYVIKSKDMKRDSKMKKLFEKCEAGLEKRKRITINNKKREIEIEERRLLCETIREKNMKINWKARKIVNRMIDNKKNAIKMTKIQLQKNKNEDFKNLLTY